MDKEEKTFLGSSTSTLSNPCLSSTLQKEDNGKTKLLAYPVERKHRNLNDFGSIWKLFKLNLI